MQMRKQFPGNGQIVFVDGGMAQYRNGNFYTGMEEPKWTREIMWPVTWWAATHLPLVKISCPKKKPEEMRKCKA